MDSPRTGRMKCKQLLTHCSKIGLKRKLCALIGIIPEMDVEIAVIRTLLLCELHTSDGRACKARLGSWGKSIYTVTNKYTRAKKKIMKKREKYRKLPELVDDLVKCARGPPPRRGH